MVDLRHAAGHQLKRIIGRVIGKCTHDYYVARASFATSCDFELVGETEINSRRGNLIDSHKPQGIRLATLLRDYESRPSSETWSRIQQLAAEILK